MYFPKPLTLKGLTEHLILILGFLLLKEMLGDAAFNSTYRDVFMINDSAPEKNALSVVWPKSA